MPSESAIYANERSPATSVGQTVLDAEVDELEGALKRANELGATPGNH